MNTSPVFPVFACGKSNVVGAPFGSIGEARALFAQVDAARGKPSAVFRFLVRVTPKPIEVRA